MPNIWTHILFCEDVMDSMANPISFTDVQAYLNLGAQGPDPFFYHNFFSWKKDKNIKRIANHLHQRHSGPFLMDMIKQTKYAKPKTKAYTFGFITHHILDWNTDPFIHYQAKNQKHNHKEFELIIDTVMMKKHRNIDAWKVPVHKEIFIGKYLDKDIEQLLKYLITRYHSDMIKEKQSKYIQKSYHDMRKALQFFFDPYAWKRLVLPSLVASFSHQPITKEEDFLNEAQNVWYDSDTNKPSNKSFLDLYEKSRAEAIEILTEVYSYWREPSLQREKGLSDIFVNISQDTDGKIYSPLTNHFSHSII